MSLASKSCELDCMPTFILKEILPSVLPTVTKIINLSLETGEFVPQWKTAIVRPIIKKAGLELIESNYRPVSNLNFLSKVLEKAALAQFMNHCDTHNLLPDFQSAYRKNYSCETALIKIMNDLLWAMEDQKVTALMAIDLSAAFDTVDHSVLLDVLRVKFGVNDGALQWFNTYLRPRNCKVNVGKSYSATQDLSFSVPQGSCAGPVLYLVYASTIKEVIPENIDIHGYADDHALKLSFNASDREEEHRSITNLESVAMDIKSWMDRNRLKMNSSKTEFIMIGSKQQLSKCVTAELNVNGDMVQQSNVVKYLGVYIDQTLSLKQHIISKCKTAMWQLSRIRHMRQVLTQDACATLVLGLVISHLDYCNAVFIGIPKCDLKRLQRVQNVAARLVLNDGTGSYDSLKKLHWLPIHLRVQYKVLTLLFKSMCGDAPSYLSDLTEIENVRRPGLRSEHSTRLKVPKIKRQTFAARSFSVMAPIWWNDLPNHVKAAETFEIFTKRLKTFLFTKF